MADCEERQLTFSAKNHTLDNNDNFSPDGLFLVYDTRETIGPGIENGQTIEKVDIRNGEETLLYRPPTVRTGEEAAPGVGAASYSFVNNVVVFIHGPPVDEVATRGYYAKPNRNGVEVRADGSGDWRLLDWRDVATNRDTSPGAQRGGTHRHEYSRDGKRIGFTYDDHLLPQYGRTIGYMQKSPHAPPGALAYFAILVAVVPEGTARPGELERTYGDSWITPHGTQRAFIGKVRGDDGVTYEESLFVIDIPEDVDITTANAGSAQRFPSPPSGLSLRRLTHSWAGGIVRGSADGKRIAYYGKDETGVIQVFIVDPDGSDRSADPVKRPIQATFFKQGAGPGLRWDPAGTRIACISDNGVALTRVERGPGFGKSLFLTAYGDAPERSNLVWSHDGRLLAYNKQVATFDERGNRVRTYDGSDFLQIFLVDVPSE